MCESNTRNIPKIVKNGQKNIPGVFYEFQDYFKNIPRFLKKYHSRNPRANLLLYVFRSQKALLNKTLLVLGQKKGALKGAF